MVHPVQVFAAENLVLMAALYLLVTALLLFVGIGLIRRRPWALPAGATFLLLGAARQSAVLMMAASGHFPASAQLDPSSADLVISIVIVMTVLSLSSLAFLQWFFRRPSIRSSFAS